MYPLQKTPSKKERAREIFSPTLFLRRTLVILRVHGRPAADLVPDEPEFRRDAVDIADLSGIAGIALGKTALRLEDRGQRLVEVAVEESGLAVYERLQIIEEVPGHTVHREPEEGDVRPDFDEDAVVEGFAVGVGRNDLPEEIVKSGRSVVLGHRVDTFLQPRFFMLWSVRLGDSPRPGQSERRPRLIKVERRRQFKQAVRVERAFG